MEAGRAGCRARPTLTHLRGQHFDELVQEAELGHLAMELAPTVVHTHLEDLYRHGPHGGQAPGSRLVSHMSTCWNRGEVSLRL